MWNVCNSFQLNISQNLLCPFGQDNLLLHFQTFMDTSCALRSKPLSHPAREHGKSVPRVNFFFDTHDVFTFPGLSRRYAYGYPRLIDTSAIWGIPHPDKFPRGNLISV